MHVHIYVLSTLSQIHKYTHTTYTVHAYMYAHALYVHAHPYIVHSHSHISIAPALLTQGLLRPGGTVVEGTAGNTGIGLAHLCKALGYKCVIYMPNNQSQVCVL